MNEPEQIRNIVSVLLFNEKGYATQEELVNESYEWKDILEFIEERFYPLGMSIKIFNYDNQKCYTIIGPEEFTNELTEKEAALLIDFIIRFETISPNKDGLVKAKWKEIIIKKEFFSSRSFTNVLRNLIKKGFLKEVSNKAKPGWRYKALLNIDEILNEIKNDAKLEYLIKSEKKERNIFD